MNFKIIETYSNGRSLVEVTFDNGKVDKWDLKIEGETKEEIQDFMFREMERYLSESENDTSNPVDDLIGKKLTALPVEEL